MVTKCWAAQYQETALEEWGLGLRLYKAYNGYEKAQASMSHCRNLHRGFTN